MLVDEFQDTNHVQYEIMRLLASAGTGLTVVGDPDQSIYSWRAADARNLRRFEQDFPNSGHISLDQCYRSTQNILVAARSVLAAGDVALDRDLWTENGVGDPVIVCEFSDSKAEAEFVMNEIYRVVADDGRSYGDFAVMYRTNLQKRALESALVDAGIPARIASGTSFYDRREVQDVLAYLRVIENPADAIAFRRAALNTAAGVGSYTLDMINEAMKWHEVSIVEAARLLVADDNQRLRNPMRGDLRQFLEVLSKLESIAAGDESRGVPSASASEMVLAVLRESRMEGALARDGDADRIDYLRELVNAARRFDGMDGQESIWAFLDDVALTKAALDREEYAPETVTLMTLHGAKGLEFPVVFITGMEEGLVPHFLSRDDDRQMAEERRLCYVGMTRAQERLYLTSASRRFDTQSREWRNTSRSRFLQDVPADRMVDVNALVEEPRLPPPSQG